MLLTEFDEKLYKKTVYREGYEDGVNEGFERGHERGISEGFERGHKRGISEAREQDIKNSIAMLKSMNVPDEKIISLIVKNYAVPAEDVIKEIK